MKKRRVRLVLLCEDTQQEVFSRRFLKEMGWETRTLRVVKNPSGKGAGEQWVREQFPAEMSACRGNSVSSGLIAIIDADTKTVETRIAEIRNVCQEQGVSFREEDEAIAVVVPKRNIETWIYYLDGAEAVDEKTRYSKLPREKDCRRAVEKLADLCKGPGLKKNAPPSLIFSCDEYQTRIKPLGRR